MKKILVLSGILTVLIGLTLIILLPASHSMIQTGLNGTKWYGGAAPIFAAGLMGDTPIKETLLVKATTKDFTGNLAWTALVSWLFILLGTLLTTLSLILPLFKSRKATNASNILKFVSTVLFITAGVLTFFTVKVFAEAQVSVKKDYAETFIKSYKLSGTWITCAILSMVCGGILVFPFVLKLFISEKEE